MNGMTGTAWHSVECTKRCFFDWENVHVWPIWPIWPHLAHALANGTQRDTPHGPCWRSLSFENAKPWPHRQYFLGFSTFFLGKNGKNKFINIHQIFIKSILEHKIDSNRKTIRKNVIHQIFIKLFISNSSNFHQMDSHQQTVFFGFSEKQTVVFSFFLKNPEIQVCIVDAAACVSHDLESSFHAFDS
jgi:hypothetical protein